MNGERGIGIVLVWYRAHLCFSETEFSCVSKVAYPLSPHLERNKVSLAIVIINVANLGSSLKDIQV